MKAHKSFSLPLAPAQLLIELVHTSLAHNFVPASNMGLQPMGAAPQHSSYHLSLSAGKDDPALPILALVLYISLIIAN